ncbi:hydrolase alpha beta fold protein [Cystoisospora suis]|uniref:Hydrolase alpha beta fold protein n=1 Tax=Cystoisospora suis TaxID=483139 RepID=A0A2C6L9R8_9APIC|nr:hydrolase alpha beta fold protein [Cystoisospora suis]
MEQRSVALPFSSSESHEDAGKETVTCSSVTREGVRGSPAAQSLFSRTVPLASVEIFPPSPWWCSSSPSSAASLVVVLHGMFRCKDDMRDLCMRLHADRVLAVDLRNHGDSPFTSSMFLQDAAADVLNLIQKELAAQPASDVSGDPLVDEVEKKCQASEDKCAGPLAYRRQRCQKGSRELVHGCEGNYSGNKEEQDSSKERACQNGVRQGETRAFPVNPPRQALPTTGETNRKDKSHVLRLPWGLGVHKTDSISVCAYPQRQGPTGEKAKEGVYKKGSRKQSHSRTERKTRSYVCCCLVGHSLGGQVAMAAALRAPPGLISSVVAIDICPVNYFDRPLPRSGVFDVRELVELAACVPTGIVPGGKEEVVRLLRKVEKATTSGPDSGGKVAESLVVLLQETEFEKDGGREHSDVEEQREFEDRRREREADTQRTEDDGAQGGKKDLRVPGGCHTWSVEMEDEKNLERREGGRTTDTSIAAATKSVAAPASMIQDLEVAECAEESLPLKVLKWRMNLPVIRESFRSQTLCWDLPSPSASALSASCSRAPPHSLASSGTASPSPPSFASSPASSGHQASERSGLLASPYITRPHVAAAGTSDLSYPSSLSPVGLQSRHLQRIAPPDLAAEENDMAVPQAFSPSSNKCRHDSDFAKATSDRCSACASSRVPTAVPGASPDTEHRGRLAELFPEARFPSSLTSTESEGEGNNRRVCFPTQLVSSASSPVDSHSFVSPPTSPEDSTRPVHPWRSSLDTQRGPPRLPQITLRQEHAAVTSFHVKPSPFVGPALLIRGLCSPWVNPGLHFPAFQAYFPEGKLICIDGASHAVHVDKPEETAAAINSLLAQIASRIAADAKKGEMQCP